MTGTRIDNPPAFPQRVVTEDGQEYWLHGMTLRDYFAAKAMQAYMTNHDVTWSNSTYRQMARECYSVADEMLKERNR